MLSGLNVELVFCVLLEIVVYLFWFGVYLVLFGLITGWLLTVVWISFSVACCLVFACLLWMIWLLGVFGFSDWLGLNFYSLLVC